MGSFVQLFSQLPTTPQSHPPFLGVLLDRLVRLLVWAVFLASSRQPRCKQFRIQGLLLIPVGRGCEYFCRYGAALRSHGHNDQRFILFICQLGQFFKQLPSSIVLFGRNIDAAQLDPVDLPLTHHVDRAAAVDRLHKHPLRRQSFGVAGGDEK
ncbi:hypothetical protein [Planktothrix sp. FACHB-1355]|uniref:hypothetical protein n=1 Tax=Planktothrix sp. FACHB-1355 TaxID=2692854 RepID=UPI001F549F41|nr:hypothetical protein [Planktothrix sp. FACHB-1355]